MKLLIVLLVEVIAVAVYVMLFADNFSGTLTYTCPFDKNMYTVTYINFAAAAFMAGCVTTLLIYLFMNISEQRVLNAYKKEREKNSVNTAEKDSQIKALENKIKTLETALNSVLNKEEDKK